jgi:hypothetical protein
MNERVNIFFLYVGISMTCHESTLRGWIWCDRWWSEAKDKDIIYCNFESRKHHYMDETLKRDIKGTCTHIYPIK